MTESSSSLGARLFPAPLPARASLGLLALRVSFGLGMAVHGYTKIQNPFHWMDSPEGAPPGVIQALAAIAEFFGGLGIATGTLTPLAALGIAATMVVAISKHVGKGDGFVRGWELAALYLAVSAALLATGPGRFSVDAWIATRRKTVTSRE